MVLIIIGLMASFYSLANGRLPPNYGQLSYENRPCSSEAGNGLCKRLANCNPYKTGEIRYSDLSRCPALGSFHVVCCPMTAQSPRMNQITPSVIPPPDPTISPIVSQRSKDYETSILPSQNWCNTTNIYKRNCYENSPCVSAAGSGSCRRLINCEPFTKKAVPYSNLSRCLFVHNVEIVCCPASIEAPKMTERIPPSVVAPQTSTRVYIRTTKKPNRNISPIVSNRSTTQRNETSSLSSSKWCDTVNGYGIGNCHEGSPCFSASVSGTCKRFGNCETVGTRVPSLSRCSFVGTVEVICCPLTKQPSSQMRRTPSKDVVADSHKNRHELTTRRNLIASRTIPSSSIMQNSRRFNSFVAASGMSCSTGTCKQAKYCQSLLDKKVMYFHLENCGGMRICCPDFSPETNMLRTVSESLEGRSCSLTSGNGMCMVLSKCQSFVMVAVKMADLEYCDSNSKQIVCCPQVTSEKPKVTMHTTTRKVPTSKPKVRPSKKACEIYKETNPARLRTHIPEERQATAGEFPHVGIMLGPDYNDHSKRSAYCGVALVSQRFALTAAQCVHDLKTTDIVVNFGSVDINPITYVEAKVKNIWINDKNKPSEDYHDIALLEFLRDVPVSQLVYPACLHVEVEDLPRSVPLQVNGWSSNNPSNDYKYPFLYNSIVNTVQLLSCNFTHHEIGLSRRYPNALHEGQYCARHAVSGECDGDAGFPLVEDINGHFEIVGIMSKPFGCSSSAPSMYTRVGYYIDWIEKIVWPTQIRK